jgi:hypothetical protein
MPPGEKLHTMDPATFLTQRVYGYADLSDSERSAISNFTFLWSAMEGALLNAAATPGALVEKCGEMALRGRIDLEDYAHSLAYFRDRYFQGGEFTENFEQLLFRRRDRRDLVEAVLSGRENTPQDVVAALLLIVYRLRNNLFHGIKWAYGIKDQEENFRHGSNVLMGVLSAYY